MLRTPPAIDRLRRVELRPEARPAPRAPAPLPARRRLGPRLLKWTRRAHLYFGIALLPWVFLYGVTALLFNHASWLGTTEVRSLDASATAPALAALPARDAVAGEALRRLRERAAEDGRELELVEGSVEWLGGVSLNGRSATASARLSLDPDGRGGRLSASSRDGEDTAPAWTAGERLDGWTPMERDARASIVDAGLVLAREAGVELDEVSVRRLPEVRFLVRDGERAYACDVDLDGGVEVRPVEDVATLRERLLRLHVQHGDPGYPGAQRLWALVVDVMGVAMVLWGLSGVVMWWTIRPTRRAGLAALVGGAALMGVLALSVWRAAGIA